MNYFYFLDQTYTLDAEGTDSRTKWPRLGALTGRHAAILSSLRQLAGTYLQRYEHSRPSSAVLYLFGVHLGNVYQGLCMVRCQRFLDILFYRDK